VEHAFINPDKRYGRYFLCVLIQNRALLYRWSNDGWFISHYITDNLTIVGTRVTLEHELDFTFNQVVVRGCENVSSAMHNRAYNVRW